MNSNDPNFLSLVWLRRWKAHRAQIERMLREQDAFEHPRQGDAALDAMDAAVEQLITLLETLRSQQGGPQA